LLIIEKFSEFFAYSVRISSSHSTMAIDSATNCIYSSFHDRSSTVSLYFPLLCRICISNVTIFYICFCCLVDNVSVVTSTRDCYDLCVSRIYFPIDIGAIFLMHPLWKEFPCCKWIISIMFDLISYSQKLLGDHLASILLQFKKRGVILRHE
jgi:hypothetical protein